ncbi:peptidoglycan-associated lipoprotein [Rhodobium orientis]|uniref:OmpA-like domain-containing protein n=1 Tax=Rhodobium orientis TaxID=34017 RepID=A0A327K091_9HYPH|nr:OmpA family protein [Rhodobium orientis]MBB4304272.1 peptidoglycan-associated lipoprotein [Rhodobium orientis]MBK5948233.1 hypothetical protein [Rhodobium orientis]RAI28778.1 hypothetical protein CH339_05085 [Rhodobium orientis]
MSMFTGEGGRRIGLFALAIAAALALGACEGGLSSVATPDKTNAPAPGFENMRAGSEEDFMLNVGRRTYFKAGSAELDDTARVTLDKQAVWLNEHTRWKIKVQGFADDPGSDAANKALSEKRAANVRDYLVAQGVDAKRMWIKGYGKERIVRDCADLVCKSQNRRAITNLRDEFES